MIEKIFIIFVACVLISALVMIYRILKKYEKRKAIAIIFLLFIVFGQIDAVQGGITAVFGWSQNIVNSFQKLIGNETGSAMALIETGAKYAEKLANEIIDEANEPVEQTEIITENGEQRPQEAYKLMEYVNQYRDEAGIHTLHWSFETEQVAKKLAESLATGQMAGREMSLNGYPVERRCNGATTAEEAVYDWMNGNAYITSEREHLLDGRYTQMGGALFYLPEGDSANYHYFWVIILQ